MPENVKAVTIEQVLAWHPCAEYTEERIAELFAGRNALTAEDVAALDISAEDRIWALLHNEFLTDKQMHLLACDFAEAVVHLCGDDPRPQAAIDAKRAWLRGEIGDAELDASRDAMDAAMAAAWDAARDAAMAAAWDAARAASMAAARAAAWAASRDEQLALLLKYIEQ